MGVIATSYFGASDDLCAAYALASRPPTSLRSLRALKWLGARLSLRSRRSAVPRFSKTKLQSNRRRQVRVGFRRLLLGGHDIDTPPASVKSSKKRKIAAPRTSASHGGKPRKRSALDALPDMPLDILDEVCVIRLQVTSYHSDRPARRSSRTWSLVILSACRVLRRHSVTCSSNTHNSHAYGENPGLVWRGVQPVQKMSPL